METKGRVSLSCLSPILRNCYKVRAVHAFASSAVPYALASFSLDRDRHGQPVSETELREIANCLRAGLKKCSFEVGGIWSSHEIYSGFPVGTGTCEIDVMSSPPEVTFNKRWCVSVGLTAPGWFRTTPETHLSDLKRAEWAVHEVLLNDLCALELFWSLGRGRWSRRRQSPTP